MDAAESLSPEEVEILECSSLVKVAKAFGVSINTVRDWKKGCPVLAMDRRPYKLADIAMYLLAKKILTVYKLTPQIQAALTVAVALDAAGKSQAGRVQAHIDAAEFVKGKSKDSLRKAAAATRTPVARRISHYCHRKPQNGLAVFVDRVWTLSQTNTPSAIELDLGTFEEKILRGFISALMGRGSQAKYSPAELESKLQSDDAFRSDLLEKVTSAEQQIAPQIGGQICEPIRKATGRTISPFMASEGGLSRLHVSGDFQRLHTPSAQ